MTVQTMSEFQTEPYNPWITSMRGGAGITDLHQAIDAARHGDETAFAALVFQYQAAAERVARRILRTEEGAADAVQDALIKAHRAMPRFQDGNFRSWLLRIVTNTCYDHLRRQKRRMAMSLDEMIEETGLEFSSRGFSTGNQEEELIDPETVTLHQESMEHLLAKIEELPAWHRDVVLLVDVQGYDYAEAADALDLPLGTVKSRLSRARSALRDSLLEANLVPEHLCKNYAHRN
ncbi:MAG: sigma-70 family RNA polymerase sigma factor [Caldilineaceae bacterium]|nr:sigma-70 family RNA polymerase sigma factor [Caldilineaceae bacterium]MCB9137735.1 sigma-70 family RNA polymerase sigma factor [Caldilineaceae bacterium]